jgi:hypothetical protein
MRRNIQTIVFFLIVAGNSSYAQNGYDTLKIPQAYDPGKHILLIASMPRLHNPNKINRSVTSLYKKSLEENYPYKFEIVSLQDITDSSKYSDTSVYRFAILNSLSSNEFIHPSTSGNTSRRQSSTSIRITHIELSFFDRVSRKQYSASGCASSWLKNVVACFSKSVKDAKTH